MPLMLVMALCVACSLYHVAFGTRLAAGTNAAGEGGGAPPPRGTFTCWHSKRSGRPPGCDSHPAAGGLTVVVAVLVVGVLTSTPVTAAVVPLPPPLRSEMPFLRSRSAAAAAPRRLAGGRRRLQRGRRPRGPCQQRLRRPLPRPLRPRHHCLRLQQARPQLDDLQVGGCLVGCVH